MTIALLLRERRLACPAASQHDMQHEYRECRKADNPVSEVDTIVHLLAAVVQQKARYRQQNHHG